MVKKVKGAFEEYVEFVTEDCFAAFEADLLGKTYLRKVKHVPITWYEFRVIETHTFEDRSMEFNNGILEDPKPVRVFKKGELISLREKESTRFMPDRSKLQFIREYTK